MFLPPPPPPLYSNLLTALPAWQNCTPLAGFHWKQDDNTIAKKKRFRQSQHFFKQHTTYFLYREQRKFDLQKSSSKTTVNQTLYRDIHRHTSFWMWSLMTIFLTLSSSWTRDVSDVVAIEVLSMSLPISSWSTLFYEQQEMRRHYKSTLFTNSKTNITKRMQHIVWGEAW